jgi:hypothetical protein
MLVAAKFVILATETWLKEFICAPASILSLFNTEGARAAVALLLKKGADINAHGSKYRHALADRLSAH